MRGPARILTQTEISIALGVLRSVNVFRNRHFLGIITALLLPAEPETLCVSSHPDEWLLR